MSYTGQFLSFVLFFGALGFVCLRSLYLKGDKLSRIMISLSATLPIVLIPSLMIFTDDGSALLSALIYEFEERGFAVLLLAPFAYGFFVLCSAIPLYGFRWLASAWEWALSD